MRIYGYLLLTLISFCSLAKANQEAIDRLYEAANLTIPEKIKTNYFEEIHGAQSSSNQNEELEALANILKAEYFTINGDFQKAKSFLEKAKPIVERKEITSLSIEFEINSIFVHRAYNEIDEAIVVATNLLPKVEERWPKHRLTHLLLELAYLKSFKYEYEKALGYLQQALRYAEESGDLYQIVETYNLLGIIYSELSDNSSSILYFQKALTLLEDNPHLYTNSYIYSNLADAYRVDKKYNRAIELLNKAQDLAKSGKDKAEISFVYQIRSRISYDEEEYGKALEYLLESKNLSADSGESLFGLEINAEFSDLYLKVGDIKKAREHLELLEKSNINSEKDSFYIERVRAKVLQAEGKHEEAYKSLENSYRNYRENFNDKFTEISMLAKQELDKERLSFENKMLEKQNELSALSREASQRFRKLLWIFIGCLIIAIAILVRFVSRYKGIAKENQRLAFTDNLTHLPNRRFLFKKLTELHQKCREESGTYSLILFDLDHFKSVNDRYGHHIGDKVIQATKGICATALRDNDVIGRIGGEEFLILLPKTALEDAKNIANKIRLAFERENFEEIVDGLNVTASFGVTQFGSEDTSPDFVVNRADRLLYRAKNNGRNCVAHSFDS